MFVKFKNPHPGVGGPVELLPKSVLDYVQRLNGRDGPLEARLGRISILAGRGYWVSVDTEKGWVLLMKKGSDPTEMVSRWKLIEFEEARF